MNNKQEVVKNVNDAFAQYGSSAAYDPMAQWAWLDDSNHKGKWSVRLVVLLTNIISWACDLDHCWCQY